MMLRSVSLRICNEINGIEAIWFEMGIKTGQGIGMGLEDISSHHTISVRSVLC